ncbi:winged helix-turn-helix domain-containing protein [Pseudoalteromonas sp. S16_S37]|uniref:winged helix-turn-helix domain-containing protein n=1 Tax=Pseudoalteromonas sp. S16_S37 TaxID=2720228 RepID=UPI001680AC9D|nr:winged helix-turn-helix domain-containing protein [Pseudoalteromonas sp. S16_S37]MBD1581129.1 hypothetical protein [Pseudoalteromonas sp. S16_S37]
MEELKLGFTNAPNYQVADKQVCFQSGDVSFGEQSIKLEPLPLAFLYFLIQHAGEVVSRQALLENVWGNRQVSDDAIRRVVKKIRVALGDDAKEPKYIKTIPMQGYVLIAPVQAVGEYNHKGSLSLLNLVEHKLKWQHFLWLQFGLFLLLFSGAYLYILKSQQSDVLVVNDDKLHIELLTQMSGSEINGSYHPKHNTLLFIYRENNDSPFALYRKNLTTGLVHRLSFDNNSYFSAFFSDDGQYVAYSKDTPTGMQSFIAKYDDKGLLDAKLLHFNFAHVYLLSFGKDNDTLYVSAPSSGHNSLKQNAIYSYSVSQKQIQQVTFPFVKGRGDYAAKLSPDGRHLAVLRNMSERRYHLLIHDLEQQNIVSEVNLSFFASNLVWLQNSSQELAITSFKGDVFYFDTRTEQLTEQQHSAPGLNDAFYSCGEKCLFMRQHHMNYKDSLEVKNPYSTADITSLSHFPNPNADFNPIYDHTGDSIYFTSKNSQHAYIKSLDKNGQEQILHTFNARHIITRLSLNSEGTKLTGKIEERIFVLDIASKQFTRVSLVEEQVGIPHWSQSGQSIYYSRLEGVEDVLYRYDLSTGKKVKVEKGLTERKELANGMSFVTDSDYRLWLEANDGTRKALLQFEHVDFLNWRVQGNYVYWTEPVKLNVYLNRYNIVTGEREQKLLFENSWDAEFSLHPSGDKILVSHSLLADSNLVKVIWP